MQYKEPIHTVIWKPIKRRKKLSDYSVAVLGAGLSGLSTAYLIVNKMPDVKVEVFEKADRIGGTIFSKRTEDGFLVEAGPNGFLSGKPTTYELSKMLKIDKDFLSANSNAELRFILKNGKLMQLPDSPGSFMFSDILSLKGKLRIAKEPFIKGFNEKAEETVAEFGTRRLGEEAVKFMLDPMVSGVFAGNVDKLSLKSCFPRIYQLEKEYGSLVKAMIKLKAKKASPSGKLTSYTSGMFHLIETLANHKNIKVNLNSEITGIEKEENKFIISGSNKKFDAVVSAMPAYCLGNLKFEPLKEVQESLKAVAYPPMAIVSFAIKKGLVKGFGFLIPSSEKRKILGALFSSNIFVNRGTDKYDLVTVMLGGDRNYSVKDFEMKKVVDVAANELADILNIEVSRLNHISLFKWNKAIPQYYKGHYKIVEKIQKITENEKGFFVTGNAFFGIGINDCTAASFEIAGRVTNYLENL
jgi:oxygen-dependent protoporphyrinogen oxidase